MRSPPGVGNKSKEIWLACKKLGMWGDVGNPTEFRVLHDAKVGDNRDKKNNNILSIYYFKWLHLIVFVD